MILDLPGGPYLIDGLRAAQREALLGRFAITGLPAAVELTIFRAPGTDFRIVDTKGWEYWLDFDHTSGLAMAGLRLMARFSADCSRAALWTPEEDGETFGTVLENVLRPLVARRLLLSGGLLVHSAAVGLDGRGYLFAGESGAGKSTMARLALAAGHPVLSDDLNAIVPDGDSFRLVPLPFRGDLRREQLSAASMPLYALIRLEKGSGELLRSMQLGESVSLIARTAPYVNRDAALTELLLDRAAHIARTTCNQVLTFRQDGDVWPILYSL